MALDQKQGEEEKEMSFLEHLEQLRWHIMRSLLAVVVIGIAAFLSKEFIFDILLFGPMKKDFFTYRVVCAISSYLCFEPTPFKLQAVELGEEFMVHLKSSFWLGIVFGFPYILWEIWRFVKPGLHKKEIKATTGIVVICSFLFVFGVLFGYYIISPFAISFLSGYDIGGVVASPTISSYVNLMTMFTIPTGIVFELPIVVYFLAKIGVVTPELMRQYRKHALIGVLILAAIITPPDMVTQLLIGFPLYALYEISIHIAKRVKAKRDD